MKRTVKRNRYISPTLLLLCLLFFMLSAKPVSASDFPLNLEDMAGNRISLMEQPHRIISLSPGTTEILFSLGLDDRIIGVTEESNYPPEARKKKQVGGLYLNYETIVSLKPDLIIIEENLRPRDIFKMKKLGLPVLVIKASRYEDFLVSLELVGKATGRPEEAARLAKKISRSLKAISDRASLVPDGDKPSVFVEIWNKPLMTAGGGTFINYVIENAGGRNVFKNMKGYPQINVESFIMSNPDVIILTTSKREEFLAKDIWKNISAVKQNRVYEINPDILVRPTLRLVKGCRMLQNWFFPDSRAGSNQTASKDE